MSTQITKRQKELLRAICEFQARHRYAPSQRDLLKPLAVTSPNTIVCILSVLLREGYVERDIRVARSLRITEKGASALLEADTSTTIPEISQ